LKLSDFDTAEEGYAAADVLVKKQRALPVFSGTAEMYPDQILGSKQLDQFYYFMHTGTLFVIDTCMGIPSI
jgi:hypothetical protein